MATQSVGPIKVVDDRRDTGISVAVGDTIGISATGLVDFGGTVLGIGQVILDADGDSWETPASYPAPNCRKNSLICEIGSSMFQGGVARSFSSTDSGSLFLRPNDDDPQNNSRGWNVRVFHTPAGEEPPPIPTWKFADLRRGRVPAAVEFGGALHVFFIDREETGPGAPSTGDFATGKLHHATLDGNLALVGDQIIDGDGGGGGRTSNLIHWQVSATDFGRAGSGGGTIHVFYFDAVAAQLRHAASADGISWTVEVLDGAGGGGGRIDGIQGAFNACASQFMAPGTTLHVFYFGTTDRSLDPDGTDPGATVTGDLRHASSSDGTSFTFETLDGNSTSGGRINANVGQHVSALLDWRGFDELNVFYFDADNGNLRHAWLTNDGWKFTTLDGAGDPHAEDPSTGRTRARVGNYSAATTWNDLIWVFYHDITYGNVRLAWGSPALGVDWKFEKLDGGGGRNGRTKAYVGTSLTSSVSFGSGADQIDAFYENRDDGILRHAFRRAGDTDWHFEDLDGVGGTGGRVESNVGLDTAAIATRDPAPMDIHIHRPPLHVFYFDIDRNMLRVARRG